jgi:hypothetical protein
LMGHLAKPNVERVGCTKLGVFVTQSDSKRVACTPTPPPGGIIGDSAKRIGPPTTVAVRPLRIPTPAPKITSLR